MKPVIEPTKKRRMKEIFCYIFGHRNIVEFVIEAPEYYEVHLFCTKCRKKSIQRSLL